VAGAGYKAFADGDVLTAAQVQTFLQDQAVMRFADSSARTTGLGTAVAEGMVSYLQDTDAVEVYDGSAWVSVGPDLVGKIIQVATVTDTTERSTTSTYDRRQYQHLVHAAGGHFNAVCNLGRHRELLQVLVER